MRLFVRRAIMTTPTSVSPDSMAVGHDHNCTDTVGIAEHKSDGESAKEVVPETTASSSCAKTVKNPIVSVSDEYMRVVGMSQPLKKFLTRNNTRPNGMVPLKLSSFVHKGVQLSNGNAKAEGILQESEVDDSVIAARQIKAAKQTVTREQLQQRLKARKRLRLKRGNICNCSVVFGSVGLILAMIEAELCAHMVITKMSWISTVLRVIILLTTIAVLITIYFHHRTELELAALDTGADDWRVVITGTRLYQFVGEMFVCSFCPLPGTGHIRWYTSGYSQESNVVPAELPVDIILMMPMFLRCYLVGRFLVLQSRLFQDSSTRTIAALNRVSVDFRFVMKTMIQHRPVAVLLGFTFAFWICITWAFVQCERTTTRGVKEDKQYLNALWFIMVTFMTIGYGDVIPTNFCGRVLAVSTGFVGVGVSAALIAVMGRNLDMTKAEKHVNAFMRDSKLAKMKKNAAASILQQIWFIYKYKYLQRTTRGQWDMRIRLHQRKFLAAITEVKWEQRKSSEANTMLVDVAQVQVDMNSSLLKLSVSQRNLKKQLDSLSDDVRDIKALLMRSCSESTSRLSVTSHMTTVAPVETHLTPTPYCRLRRNSWGLLRKELGFP